jgi:hypothetical protein
MAPFSVNDAALKEIVDELASGEVVGTPQNTLTEETPIEEFDGDANAKMPDPPVPQVIAPQPKVPLKNRLATIGRCVLDGLTVVPNTIANFVLRLFVLLDRPFREMSSEAKLRIGLVGLVTILMGSAAWVLPCMISHNPYLEIGPRPAVANSHHE